ncbi:uncharacterized protein C2845_PM15G15290 [Panicum miliaceum]|uniref:Serine/arginine repetitive matrix protein 2-like n=1 Tax=Panicum miliaceum TaxID=4540 RepID=A0A3L6Q7K1_PANMI|nr:uncharacterized protein C2845_PM15G15290 [Panicum miliaceum]
MGLCFSKKQQAKRRDGQPSIDAKRSGGRKSGRGADAKKEPQAKAPAPAPAKKAVARPEEPAADKRTVFVVKAAAAAAAAEVAAAAKGGSEGAEAKRAPPEEAAARPVAVGRAPVRTSSCTKEEVDAILIQCGRLSRSSSASGKAPSGEHGGGHRRYAGSKRSYDFDHERRGADECDWGREGAAASRPSPRRRTPERKRSASHDGRTGGGSGSRSRRVSRSPGRRADVAPAAGSSGTGERGARQQPGKMVSVPARDKGRAPSPVKAASSGKRYPSPRSNSPARAAAAGNENVGVQPTHGPSLSRSSSRKAEQSPYPRNPMAELDENALGNNHHHNNGNNSKLQKKSADAVVALPQKTAERPKDQIPISRAAKGKEVVEEAVASDTKASSARMNATHSVSIVAENVINPRPGSRSSRRSSRDFDHNGNSYASLLLEDIQNYHQQSTSAAAAPTFALPACVSKACSILDAVADLNSSSSENKSFELERSVNDKESVNGRYGGKGPGISHVVESEVVVKDVSVRDIRGVGEAEPQESAGSNSFAGNAWTCSWEPNSVDSTDRTRTASQSYNGDEVEQVTEQSWQSKQEPSRRDSASNVQLQRVRGAHRGSGSAVSGRSDACGVSASSSIV